MKKLSFNILLLFIFLIIFNLNGFSRDLFVFSENKTINQSVDGDLIVFFSRIKINSHIKGDVISFWGEINVGKNGVVDGDLIIVGGTLKKNEKGKINGAVIRFFKEKNFKDLTGNIFKSDLKNHSVIFNLGVFILWFFISIGVLKLYKEKIIHLVKQVRDFPLKSFGAGILSVILLFSIFLLLLILVIFIIGIPFILLYILFLLIIKIIERTVIFYFLGELIHSWVKFKKSDVLIIIIGVIVFSLLRFSGSIGYLIAMVLDVISIGAIFLQIIKSKQKV